MKPSLRTGSLAATTLASSVAVLLGGTLTTESAKAAVVNVYWTDRDNATLSVTSVATGLTTVLVPSGFSRLQDVDLDSNTNTLYFADWGPVGGPGGEGSINRVNTDGTGLGTVLATGDAVHQLVLEGGDIYFTRAVSYDNREISRVGTNGLGYTVLHSGSGSGTNGWFYSGLAVDSPNNVLYWGDIGILTPAPPADGAVNSMTLVPPGGSLTTLVPHVDGKGRGFALDQQSQTIFYTAHDATNMPGTGGAVFKYDIASGNDMQIVPDDPTTGYWDIQIDPFTQRIWWTAYALGQVRSATFTGTDVQIELSGLTNPYGLALQFAECAEIDDKEILCKAKPGGLPGCYQYTFNLTNNSGVTVQYLLLPNAETTPHVLDIGPLANGATTTVTIQICNVPPPAVDYCFDIILADAAGQECCALEICVNLPKCCITIKDEAYGEPTCEPDGTVTWDFLFTINNVTNPPEVLEHAFLIPLTPGVTFDPDYFDLPSVGFGGSVSLVTTVNAPAGQQLCFLLTVHDQSLKECCSLEVCIEAPECPSGDCCGCNSGPPGCDNPACDAVVCAVDPFCCDVAWDAICCEEALVLCVDICDGSPVHCPGDCNGDGVVDVVDFLELLAEWGPCGPPGCMSDFDGNDAVDVSDMLVLLASWGDCP